MAGEVHLVPFRTQKLSPRAPMVLRSKSVGEQDVADQQGAFAISSTRAVPDQGRPFFFVRQLSFTPVRRVEIIGNRIYPAGSFSVLRINIDSRIRHITI